MFSQKSDDVCEYYTIQKAKRQVFIIETLNKKEYCFFINFVSSRNWETRKTKIEVKKR